MDERGGIPPGGNPKPPSLVIRSRMVLTNERDSVDYGGFQKRGR